MKMTFFYKIEGHYLPNIASSSPDFNNFGS